MLKPHQDKDLRSMLFHMCSRRDSGMLLYHFMGTGKSVVALSIAANFANNITSVYIVCPEHIRFVWHMEIEKWKPPFKPIVQCYSEFATVEDKKIHHACVIFDEPQRIVDRDMFSNVLLKLSKGRVRLLLSGTPANSIKDMLTLMRSVVPKAFPSRLDETLSEFMDHSKLIQCMQNVKHYAPFVLKALLPIVGLTDSPAFAAPVGSLALLFFSFWALTPKLSTKWNIAKLVDKASSIISFTNDPAEEENESFAKMNTIAKHIDLTSEQLGVIDSFVGQTIEPRTLVDMEIINDVEELNYKDWFSVTNIQKFMDKGRSVGMYGKIPPKLAALDKLVEDKKKTMVYTSFKSILGVKGLEKHFHTTGQRYCIVSKDESKEKNIENTNIFNKADSDIILINYGIQEGMSLTATRRIVFLESPMSVSEYKQVIARGRRLESHSHLPVKERSVDVVVLIGHFGTGTEVQQKLGQLASE